MEPIFGAKIFMHESDIHISGILQNERMFEALDPSLVGRRHEIVFGKLSGRRSISLFLEGEGIELSDESLQILAERVKHLTKSGGYIFPNDLVKMARSVGKSRKHAGV